MIWASWLFDPVDHQVHPIIRQDNSVVRAYAQSTMKLKSHLGQLSIWNQKLLPQNEYHIY